MLLTKLYNLEIGHMVKGSHMAKSSHEREAERKLVRVSGEEARKGEFTPEMWEIAEALAHPEGDPYDNARKMGFYCEQCG